MRAFLLSDAAYLIGLAITIGAIGLWLWLLDDWLDRREPPPPIPWRTSDRERQAQEARLKALVTPITRQDYVRSLHEPRLHLVTKRKA